jgi:hypothetical protein
MCLFNSTTATWRCLGNVNDNLMTIKLPYIMHICPDLHIGKRFAYFTTNTDLTLTHVHQSKHAHTNTQLHTCSIQTRTRTQFQSYSSSIFTLYVTNNFNGSTERYIENWRRTFAICSRESSVCTFARVPSQCDNAGSSVHTRWTVAWICETINV